MQNLHGDLMSIHGLTSSNISQSLLTFNTSMSSLNESLDKSEDPSESYDKIPNQPPDEQNQSKEANTSTAEAVDPLEHFVVNRDTDELKLKQEERIVISPDLGSVAGNINPDACYDPENMTFDCPLCDFKAQSAASLARHNGAIHKGIRWKCKDCDFITRDKSSLKRHRRNRHDGIRFQCNYCDYDAGQKGNIKSHMDRKHPEIPYDHTEFQEVKVEKSKYTREAKHEKEPVEPRNANGVAMSQVAAGLLGLGGLNRFSAHLLQSLLQAKMREETAAFNSTDEDSIVHSSDKEEDQMDGNEADSRFEEEEQEKERFRTPSPGPSLTSTPVKEQSSSLLLNALGSLPSSSSSPTLTPRKSLLDLLNVNQNALDEEKDEPIVVPTTPVSVSTSPQFPRGVRSR